MIPTSSAEHRLSLVLRLVAQPRTLTELLNELPYARADLTSALTELVETGIVAPADSGETGMDRRYRLAATAPGGPRSGFAGGSALPSLDEAPERERWLRRISLFSFLSDTSLAKLAGSAIKVRVPARATLFEEGGPCAGIYIVESGVIKLLKQVGDGTGGGRGQVIRLVAANDFFNEVPVFDGGLNPVSAEAIEESQVLLLPRESVRWLMEHDPVFVQHVIADLAGRVRHLIAMVQDLSLRQVSGRVAKILLQSIEPNEGVGAGAERHPRMTQRDIAEMAGTVREVVARTLRDMEQSGAIELDAGRVTKVNRARLIELL